MHREEARRKLGGRTVARQVDLHGRSRAISDACHRRPPAPHVPRPGGFSCPTPSAAAPFSVAPPSPPWPQPGGATPPRPRGAVDQAEPSAVCGGVQLERDSGHQRGGGPDAEGDRHPGRRGRRGQDPGAGSARQLGGIRWAPQRRRRRAARRLLHARADQAGRRGGGAGGNQDAIARWRGWCSSTPTTSCWWARGPRSSR